MFFLLNVVVAEDLAEDLNNSGKLDLLTSLFCPDRINPEGGDNGKDWVLQIGGVQKVVFLSRNSDEALVQ